MCSLGTGGLPVPHCTAPTVCWQWKKPSRWGFVGKGCLLLIHIPLGTWSTRWSWHCLCQLVGNANVARGKQGDEDFCPCVLMMAKETTRQAYDSDWQISFGEGCQFSMSQLVCLDCSSVMKTYYLWKSEPSLSFWSIHSAKTLSFICSCLSVRHDDNYPAMWEVTPLY